MNKLPDVNEIGRILESEGLVTFGESAYNQSGSNCFETASAAAELFGYRPIGSRELIDLIFRKRSERLWGGDLHPRFDSRSPACLVIRTPDNPRDVHVSFEFCGREYNYGACTEQGFPIEMRIPLIAKSDSIDE